MAKQKLETVGEILYWSYANLAMAHMAVENSKEKYGVPNYVVRAKLFKGLKDGSMKMGTIFSDEKIKLKTGQYCNYCGSPESLSLDHVLPQKRGGQDNAENLIYACRRCNSSKGI